MAQPKLNIPWEEIDAWLKDCLCGETEDNKSESE